MDTDHIKDTACFDPTDGREHEINKVDISHMFCVSPAEVRADQLASSCVQSYPIINLLLILINFSFYQIS